MLFNARLAIHFNAFVEADDFQQAEALLTAEYAQQLRRSVVVTFPQTVLFNKVDDIGAFVNLCKDPHTDIYELFEDGCTQELRDRIYELAGDECNEPTRAALYALGMLFKCQRAPSATTLVRSVRRLLIVVSTASWPCAPAPFCASCGVTRAASTTTCSVTTIAHRPRQQR